MKRQALGRGLDALLPAAPSPNSHALVEIGLDQIRPNSFQPRLQFEAEKLEELASSISENGVLQPIVVRQTADGYEIVAGERRWRAAQKAGLESIPALIKDVSEEKLLALALVENIQRDDLSSIEEAQAYQLLMEEFHLTQEEIARRVGRSRTAVANTLRLLKLPRPIQEALRRGEISMGHARALLPLPAGDQLALAGRIARQGLSVRDVERRVRRQQQRLRAATAARDPNLKAAEERLEQRWKTRVDIRRRGATGQIRLHFHSEAELERLYEGLLSV